MLYAASLSEFDESYNDQFGDVFDDSHYDAFLKKWRTKRTARRRANPKVIARKTKRNEKRIEKGKAPIRFYRKPLEPAVSTVKTAPPLRTVVPKGSAANPITKKDLNNHAKGHAAIQNEHKTMQEEAKTEILEAKAATEKLGIASKVLENEKAKNSIQTASMGKIGIVIGLLLLGGYLMRRDQAKIA